MKTEEKIKELQERIYQLSANVNDAQHEVRLLQAELETLKSGSPSINHETEIFYTDNTIKTPSSSEHGSLENFIGLKLIHLVGIVVLVVGISIGVKYAIDKELISEAMRIALAYGAGILLFILSLRLKKKYQFFSAILFSGSMATFYFTTYAAFVYYNFMPPVAAFLLMTAFTVYTVIAAMSYNRQEIAILGMIGAYGIPFLISANSEKVELFFSYILLINIGMVFLSFKKSWKLMGQLAMVITWILFIGWGFFRYDPSKQWIASVFMLVYYFLFIINALAFRISKKDNLSGREVQQIIVNNTALYVAAIIVFNNDLSGEGFASVTGLMFLFLALIAIISTVVLSSEIILQRLIAWQALLLLILFIAFQWEGLMVTLLWVAVAVLLFIWGILNKKAWPRLGSVLLIGATLAKLIIFDSAQFSTVQKILSFIIIGVLLLLGSFYYQKFNLSQKNKESNY
ncbi:MAG: DUF2339 domain-containing protein [Chitinophagaceae bacterium]